MNAVCPFPILSAGLAATWLALTGVSPAQLALAIVSALAIPRLAAPLLAPLPGVRSFRAAVRLTAVVAWDILLANIAVARLVLGPMSRLRPGFVRVPLAVTHPHAIALLASIVSIVPGSVSIALSSDTRTLLLHVLHVENEEQFVARIKQRYERPLMDVLEC
jgi:multicomponent K+:H+ antiporter subunit E